ncbi:MAG: SixA phosphatase family protein [Cellvibrionaceae bacterium]
MYVFFMRHGEAVTQAESDAARSLTEAGREDVGATIKRSMQEPVFADAIDEIWCSHYVRAQQSAEIVSSLINKPVITKEGLSPTDNPDNLLQEIRDAEKTILVVSHQPLLGTLVDRFAGLETGRYRMGTSALAAIESELVAYGCGELKWLHQPS